MATKKSKKKSKNEESSGGKVKHMLPVQIDEKAKHAKEAEIRGLLTANVLLKEEAKPFNDKRKQNTERIDKLRSEAESLTEEREVKCAVIYDFAHRLVKFKRLDTNKLVPELERTMSDDERQEDLLDTRPKKSKTKAAKEKEPKPGTPEEQLAAEKEHAKHYDDAPEGDDARADA